jgi:hypothetical protein
MITTLTPQTLPDIYDDAVCFGIEHQLNLINTFGDRPRWEYSYPDRVRLIGDTATTFAVQILGTVHNGLWKWAWDDPDLPDTVIEAATRTSIYGDLHGVAPFTEPVLWVDTTTAIQIVAATKPVTGHWMTFSFNTTDDWTVYAALVDPTPTLPAPTSVAVAQVLGVAAELMRDAPRAVAAYARHRGLRTMNVGSETFLGQDDWRVAVRWGPHNEIAALRVESDA